MATYRGSPRGWHPWRRVTVAEIMAARTAPAAAPPHKPAVPLSGPLQTRRTTRLPAPPPRIRPPDLLAQEQGVQLYGARSYDRGNVAIARLRALEAPSLRLVCDFDASSVTVHNLGAKRLVVSTGDAEPLVENAVGFVPASGWSTITLGGVRVLRVGTVDATAVTAQVVVTASDRVLAPGAGPL